MIAISFRKNRSVKEANSVLVRDAVAGNTAVVKLLFLAEFVIFVGFYGMLGVDMKLFDSEVILIDFFSNPRRQSDARHLEQCEIMGFSVGESSTDTLACGFIYDDLHL
jgi:hypothetical protein